MTAAYRFRPPKKETGRRGGRPEDAALGRLPADHITDLDAHPVDPVIGWFTAAGPIARARQRATYRRRGRR
jgi:hypothetical protein